MYKKYAELRDKRNLTDYRVAAETGISTATLSNWKNGNYVPKFDKLLLLAKYFDVPVEYFCGRRKGVREVQNVDKAEWLKAIGAKEFPEPVKYAYTFPGYSGAFNLSERYVEESDLKELKAQYEKNKAHALEVIKAKKELDTHC